MGRQVGTRWGAETAGGIAAGTLRLPPWRGYRTKVLWIPGPALELEPVVTDHAEILDVLNVRSSILMDQPVAQTK